MFSCEFREISKNTFFIEHLRATASEAVWRNCFSRCSYDFISFCVGFTGNFPILYCCKDYKNLTRDKKFLQRRFFLWFGGFESSSGNIRSFLSLGLESSISCNWIFFKSGFFSIFWARKVTSWNFLILGLEISVFRNIRKFRFLKYGKSFFKKI